MPPHNSRLTPSISIIRTVSPYFSVKNAIAPLGFRFLARLGIRRAHGVIPQALQTRTDELWMALAKSFELNRRSPQTLLHGDPHVGQTYITSTGKMGYADWQLVMRGGWAFDVAYALVSALTIENRRQWERDLLRYYLDQLHAAGGSQIPFDDAWTSYRQNTIYPYFCWLMTLTGTFLPLMPKMQTKKVSLDIIERASNAICDLDSLEVVGA